MNSCLYETDIFHQRLTPREHKFSYKFFSFYLDLDEMDEVVRSISLLSRNRFNVYAFFDKDHIQHEGGNIKDNILIYLNGQGIDLRGGRIMLLTYLRTFGYVFNPVSFYYCFDDKGRPVCVVPEIGNTFGELKPFLICEDHLMGDKFKDVQDKYYYISPFNRLDDQLNFRLTIPAEKLNIHIDTSRDGEKQILTSMTGSRTELNNKNLFWLSCRFPFITLKIISLIHWHAFRLWIKKVPFEEKTSNAHLQKGVYRAWSKGHN